MKPNKGRGLGKMDPHRLPVGLPPGHQHLKTIKAQFQMKLRNDYRLSSHRRSLSLPNPQLHTCLNKDYDHLRLPMPGIRNERSQQPFDHQNKDGHWNYHRRECNAPIFHWVIGYWHPSSRYLCLHNHE